MPQEKAVTLLIATVTQPLVTFSAEPLGVSSLVVYTVAVSALTSFPLGGSSRGHLDWVVVGEGQVRNLHAQHSGEYSSHLSTHVLASCGTS